MDVGNTTFHNWKKGDRGSLNFVKALTESCDTWFYQVGIKTGAGPILDWAAKSASARNAAFRCEPKPKGACLATNT